jgi:RNA polymerase sigma factor (TIGR02999 family)
MSSTDPKPLIAELSRGPSAAEALIPLVYDELRGLAAAQLRRERSDHTLQPTALVHEAFLKLAQQTEVTWQNRAHFFAVAAEAIRRILIDYARKRNSAKRGGDWQRVTLWDGAAQTAPQEADLLALGDALDRLERLHPRQAQVVKLRYFGGLTSEESAYVLNVSRSTVADDWTVARAWLLSELREAD